LCNMHDLSPSIATPLHGRFVAPSKMTLSHAARR
jgi:hypothetical protein